MDNYTQSYTSMWRELEKVMDIDERPCEGKTSHRLIFCWWQHILLVVISLTWQYGPEWQLSQAQTGPTVESSQVPPFTHGLLHAHSCTSQFCPTKHWSVQEQVGWPPTMEQVCDGLHGLLHSHELILSVHPGPVVQLSAQAHVFCN